MLAVNGESCVGWSVTAVREKIVGPVGSQVVLRLQSAASGILVVLKTWLQGPASSLLNFKYQQVRSTKGYWCVVQSRESIGKRLPYPRRISPDL